MLSPTLTEDVPEGEIVPKSFDDAVIVYTLDNGSFVYT